jgi:hypothetical protein
MKRFARWLLGALALSGLLLLALFAGHAKAQVSDRPITVWPTEWTGTVIHVTTNGGCVAGWKRGTKDRFEPYYLQQAALDVSRLHGQQLHTITQAISAQQLATLASMRTISLRDQFPANNDPAMQPCIDKLQPPPKTWVVAPDADGFRPAYCLDPVTKKRGAVCGKAPTVFEGGQMSCYPWVRSVETTSSVYGTWPTAKDGFDPQEPVRVTLCREAK